MFNVSLLNESVYLFKNSKKFTDPKLQNVTVSLQ